MEAAPHQRKPWSGNEERSDDSLSSSPTGASPWLVAVHEERQETVRSTSQHSDELASDGSKPSIDDERKTDLSPYLLELFKWKRRTQHWCGFIGQKASSSCTGGRSWLVQSSSGGCMMWMIVCLVIVWIIGQLFVVQVSLDEVKSRPLLVGARRLQSASVGSGGQADPDFAKEMARAFDEWKVIQEKYPNKFLNFSQFLMEEKAKETRLRSKLNRLSRKSLNMVASIVVPPAQPPPQYTKEEDYELKWTYLSAEKAWPYVGSDRYLDRFRTGSRHYYNSLAVFPHSNRTRLHGLVGIWPNGTRAWQPAAMPPKIDDFPGGKSAALKNGGFYLNLSNALPLDRDGPDTREDFCKSEFYNLDEYDDATVIITYYNEPPSTLLRSVHSVLNRTPPPLLREIILVDDHSNNTENLPGGYLYEYVKLLPKVKLMRLPERRGLVQARIAGAKLAKAPVIVILDSHIEVNVNWLEPQLKRLRESPRSVVFPQIMSLDSEDLRFRSDAGIGCFLSFKWIMQERPYFTKVSSADPVSSPSMAGGLFAVRRDWFFESGAYDEEFSMWGAENVEMGFRIWMCGGRVECTPCARTYHIYRHGGSGYSSPGEYIKKNRIRTARIWLDEWWQVAQHFIDHSDVDVGSFDKMLELKERLQCKNFTWFLHNVDPNREGTNLASFGLVGYLRSLAGSGRKCLDDMSHRHGGEPIDMYECHYQGGAQGFFEMKDARRIRNMAHENLCLGIDLKMTHCDQPNKDDRWISVAAKKWVAFLKPDAGNAFDSLDYEKDYDCLGVENNKPKMLPCRDGNPNITWEYKMFKLDSNFQLPTISPERRVALEKRRLTVSSV